MKNNLLIILFGLLSHTFCNAQSAEKIKGNRNVTIQTTDLPSYHTIALDEDFEIEIIYSASPYIEIETDENLHEVIKFQVIDSVLTFNQSLKITSKKRLKIKVAFDDALKHIETSGDSELLSLTALDLANGSLKTRESSKVGLTVKSENFEVDTDDKSRVKLNLTS